MLALALALGVATAPPPQKPAVQIIQDMPIVMRERACGLWHGTPVDHKGPIPQARKLGDLPTANLELAVLRLDANGCQKPVVVRYDYRGDGHFAAADGK